MIISSKKDIKHKNEIFKLLREILKDPFLSQNLMFKGGTYASLRGVLNRFSVDLDFDLPNKEKKSVIRDRCYEIFKKLNLTIKDESINYLQFFLRYDAPDGERNTLKLEINDDVNSCNKYEKIVLEQVNMYCNGHTLDTMFANKLIACKARFDKNGKIAGRDFYDVYQFFIQGIDINKDVIEEASGQSYVEYLKSLIIFINSNLTDKLINQDLNPLMRQSDIDNILPHLRDDLIVFLSDEVDRANS